MGMSADSSAKSSGVSLRCGRGPSALRKPGKTGRALAIGAHPLVRPFQRNEFRAPADIPRVLPIGFQGKRGPY